MGDGGRHAPKQLLVDRSGWVGMEDAGQATHEAAPLSDAQCLNCGENGTAALPQPGLPV
jgi:hypothetical protein